MGLANISPEALATLNSALHDPVADIRANVAVSLGQLKHVSPEVLAGLLVALRRARSYWIRRDAAQILGQLSPENNTTLNALWRGLQDEDDEVRMASAQAIAQWAKRFPTSAPALETRLLEAIQSTQFAKPDKRQKRPAWDYAYEAFWLLVVGQEEKQ